MNISTILDQNSVECFSGSLTKFWLILGTKFKIRMRQMSDHDSTSVETVAHSPMEDVRKMLCNTTTYLGFNDLSVKSMSHLVPELLQCFLNIIIQSKSDKQSKMELKCNSIGQALISDCRPQLFLPPSQWPRYIYVYIRNVPQNN